jgi:hypothetical protein
MLSPNLQKKDIIEGKDINLAEVNAPSIDVIWLSFPPNGIVEEVCLEHVLVLSKIARSSSQKAS